MVHTYLYYMNKQQQEVNADVAKKGIADTDHSWGAKDEWSGKKMSKIQQLLSVSVWMTD